MTTPATAPRPLENGDVMSSDEFHRIYSECEGLERVELIEGVVYLPSPVRITEHQRPEKLVFVWLDAYEQRHLGAVEAMQGGTVRLDSSNEPIPDVMLYELRPGRIVDGYFVGAPELVVEISASTVSRDLHFKKRAYERNGVLEYIVWRVLDGAIDWFQLRDGVYVVRETDEAGIIASEVFPGLRLDVPAMLAQDRKRVLSALD